MFRDLKIAVRHLSKSPGFSLTAVLMLALGIGATTAIFSIVEGVLLRPLPFPHSEQLVALSDTIQGADVGGNNEAGVTGPDIVNYTRDTHSFVALGGYTFAAYELSGMGDPAQVNAGRMSPGAFAALAAEPLLGRVFTAEEDTQHQQVAVLSYATWQSRFHGDASILGKKILLDRKPYVVIGIMPRNFEFPLVAGHLNRSELWIPLSLRPDELAGGAQANWSYSMVGRLKPGVTPEQAREDANRVAQQTMRNYPAFMASLRISPVVHGLHENTIAQARPLIRTLFLAVTVVLLIACANLAGLLLVRAIRRRREIAVRLALGSSARTLLRQALLESLVLSVSGGVLGLILAAIALKLGTSLLPETLPLIGSVGLDWMVATFALALAIVTGVLCGVAPAFAAIRTSVNETLKEGGRTGTSGAGHARLRSGLVIAEIAVALILLAASGLLLRSFEKMREADLGYRPDHTVVAAYNLPRKQYATQPAVDQFNQELLRRVQGIPGVTSAGLTSFLPANGSQGNSAFVAEGYAPAKPGQIDLATPLQVQGDLFRAMGIPLLRGRLFTEADDNPKAQLVAVVNQQFAQQSWPGQNPIGKRMRIGTPEMQTPWATVVGEVSSMKEGSPDVATSAAVLHHHRPGGNVLRLAGQRRCRSERQWRLHRAAHLAAAGSGGKPAEGRGPLARSAIATDTVTNHGSRHQRLRSAAPLQYCADLLVRRGSAAAGHSGHLQPDRVHGGNARPGDGHPHGAWIAALRHRQPDPVLRPQTRRAGCLIGLAGAFFASRLLKTFVFGVSTLDPLVLIVPRSWS